MRRNNTELLRDVIGQFLKENKLEKQLHEKRLMDAWPRVLGENIKQYTTQLNVRNRVLYVKLSSSVLRHELFLTKEQIVQSLNTAVGALVIDDIVFT
jgi:predicted nucleic acid-binding Zn ribbon protein